MRKVTKQKHINRFSNFISDENKHLFAKPTINNKKDNAERKKKHDRDKPCQERSTCTDNYKGKLLSYCLQMTVEPMQQMSVPHN